MRWPVVAMSELCEVLDRLRKPITKKDRVEGPYPYYGATGVLSYVDNFIFDEDLVLVGEDGAKWGAGDNSAFRISGKTWVNNHAHVLRPLRSKVLDQWLIYYLNGMDLSGFITGMTVPKLNQGKLKEIPVPLPSIQEQKRIVAILDKAYAEIEQARANTEQNLKNARELFESYLQQVFSQRGEGWIDYTLAEVSLDFGRGKSRHRPRNDESLYGGDYPFIQTGDVRNSEHIIENFSKTYNEKGLAQSKLWPKGTICITIAANIAETGILGFDGCFPDSVIGVVVNPALTTVDYVEYLLQSFQVILKAKGKGSAQDNINMGTFEEMRFPFPSLDAQKKIVATLSELMASVQALEELYFTKEASLEELKKSILNKAFAGELTKAENKGVAV